mgnify:FL=1
MCNPIDHVLFHHFKVYYFNEYTLFHFKVVFIFFILVKISKKLNAGDFVKNSMATRRGLPKMTGQAVIFASSCLP